MPSMITASFHPKVAIRIAQNGGRMNCPNAVPVFTTPVIIPRRRSNHRAMTESVTTSCVAMPALMNSPNRTNICQTSVTWLIIA